LENIIYQNTCDTGEIVLEMLSILSNLQVNNWNENRKKFNESKVFLTEFKSILMTLNSQLVKVMKIRLKF